MLKKLWPRQKASPARDPLEAYLEEALTPVRPRPEFVSSLRQHLMASYPQVQRTVKPSPAAPLTGLGAALRQYTSAQVALNGLRLWRVLLALAIFVLGSGRSLAESKS